MMTLQEIATAVADGSVKGVQAEEILREYPYFTLPALVALENDRNMSADLRQSLSRRVAISLGNGTQLASLLGEDAAMFENFYPTETQTTPSTSDTLDSFLEKYGSGSDRESEILEEMIFSSTPDYGAVLAMEATSARSQLPGSAEASAQDMLIDQFLNEQAESANSPKKPVEESSSTTSSSSTTEESADDKSPSKSAAKSQETLALTESLAKVMIKNRNYAKALEIISQLHLNNPEKSVYFAHQIRFLKKLIINEKQK